LIREIFPIFSASAQTDSRRIVHSTPEDCQVCSCPVVIQSLLLKEKIVKFISMRQQNSEPNDQMGDAPRLEFVSAVVSPGNPVVLTVTAPSRLVISNVCIPEIDPSTPSQPSRLFGTVLGGPDRALIATLVPGHAEAEMVGFKVLPDHRCRLETVGPHPVHIIGYLEPPEQEGGSEEEEEEEEES
jgi:hypothetical protein